MCNEIRSQQPLPESLSTLKKAFVKKRGLYFVVFVTSISLLPKSTFLHTFLRSTFELVTLWFFGSFCRLIAEELTTFQLSHRWWMSHKRVISIHLWSNPLRFRTKTFSNFFYAPDFFDLHHGQICFMLTFYFKNLDLWNLFLCIFRWKFCMSEIWRVLWQKKRSKRFSRNLAK